jgi:hypothetical protein
MPLAKSLAKWIRLAVANTTPAASRIRWRLLLCGKIIRGGSPDG